MQEDHDQKHEALVESHLQVSARPGVRRYIGKTMGVMAGGAFADKVADVSVMAGEGWKGEAERADY